MRQSGLGSSAGETSCSLHTATEQQITEQQNTERGATEHRATEHNATEYTATFSKILELKCLLWRGLQSSMTQNLDWILMWKFHFSMNIKNIFI